MEVKKNFVEVSMSGSQEKLAGKNEVQDMESLLLATFLTTCMKLL